MGDTGPCGLVPKYITIMVEYGDDPNGPAGGTDRYRRFGILSLCNTIVIKKEEYYSASKSIH